jgi:hypothetical protein
MWRRPHSEAHTRDILHRHRRGAEGAGESEMPPLRDQVKVELAEHEAEAVRILRLLFAMRPSDSEPVATGERQQAGEETGNGPFRQWRGLTSAVGAGRHGERARQERTDEAALFNSVRAEDGEWIVYPAGGQLVQDLRIERRHSGHATPSAARSRTRSAKLASARPSQSGRLSNS